jgi:hypothetical protein
MLGDQLGPLSEGFLQEGEQLGASIGGEKRGAHQRFVKKLPVVMRPSSSSQRRREEISGVCKNLSPTGCGVVCDRAPRVGDLYRFELSEQSLHPLNGVHARCVRCHLVDEDVFDSGFCFLAPIDLADVDVLDQLQEISQDSYPSDLLG